MSPRTSACPGSCVVVMGLFVRSTVVAFLGCCFSLSKNPPVSLQHFGERKELLDAAGSGKSGALRVLPMLQQGVSPRLEMEGSVCVRSLCLALHSFSRTVSAGGVLAFGAVRFRQDECRPEASA
eukprot:s1935_g3.t1